MMAIAKKGIRHLRREQKRTTWTRFHLRRGQDWPKWMTGRLNIYLGPLADVTGRGKVRLGRKVDDPEQAALIVLWESADALKDFQHSPLCSEFLQSLGCENENESLLSLQWDSGFSMGENLGQADDLHGRMTLTTFNIPYTGVPDARHGAALLPTPSAAETIRGQAVCYQFFRLNGNGASPEREEASARDPGAHELWAKTVAKAMPPVEAWKQERWDIEEAPCCLDSETDEGD
ncbi:hypothetical protein QBC33DRAFT_614563 [Phialemonium atrogriseum]|uniref:ABM domain-containing protein n=1 Tax=Phialemonium atrogriseum TaxID=1093897 RepID=A0AAJ0BS39_9PEZI|nr:uncharacterized protein QBC33DRAFT_614563 [Phialemonium atrogriseum]KAK1762007.1 hypothetical protein QBC33DRAFT_614563 [Phialemonium atrogriseum]